MNRIKIIEKTLDHYFPNPKPFLCFKDFYTLLVAVVLSAQCSDAKVNRVTKKLYTIADTPETMIAIPIKILEKVLHPLGLFHRKAKIVHDLSKKLTLTPPKSPLFKTRKFLESLPGVGRKTASVVLSQAFNIPTFPVDTHIKRLANRWQLSSSENVNIIEKRLKKLFKRKEWKKRHLQMIAFGRKYCKARGHTVEKCPICKQLQSPC